jgi:hypothetical protein
MTPSDALINEQHQSLCVMMQALKQGNSHVLADWLHMLTAAASKGCDDIHFHVLGCLLSL